MFQKKSIKITDRGKAPRSSWIENCTHPEVVKTMHESYSKTINKTMLSLLGVGLYSLLAVASSPDKSLIATNSSIQTPLVGTSISFQGFLIVSPFLLVILIVYLHILFGYWLQLEKKRKDMNEQSLKNGEPTIESVPAIFSFSDLLPRFVTNFIFYWFVPLVLCFLVYKAFALKEFIRPMFYVASFVTISLLFLQINRCPKERRRWWNTPRWILLALVVGYMGYFPSVSDSFRRPLNLQREDLHDAWLQGVDLTGADMSNANLKGANLRMAQLQGVSLIGANLQGTNLRGASLKNAQLNEANFQGANLGGADLAKADLFSANFREVKEMEPYRIKTAENWNRAFYSNEFISIFKLSPTHNEDLEKIGNYYGGGKIAYIFQPGDKGYVDGERHGLIAAEADLPGGDKYTWEAARKACDELSEHDCIDWRLPSKEELNQLYLNRSAVGGFSVNFYWSSTEHSAFNAWFQYFYHGIQYYYFKYYKWCVRAVRAFNYLSIQQLRGYRGQRPQSKNILDYGALL